MALVAVNLANPFKNSQGTKRHYLPRINSVTCKQEALLPLPPALLWGIHPSRPRKEAAPPPHLQQSPFPQPLALSMQLPGTTPSWDLTEEASEGGSQFLLS